MTVTVKRRCQECKSYVTRDALDPVYLNANFDVCRKCAPGLRESAAAAIRALLAGELIDQWW